LYQDDKNNYTLTSIGLVDFDVNQIEGKLSKKVEISEMIQYGNYIILNASAFKSSGYSYSKNTYLVSINLENGEQIISAVSINDYKGKNIEVIGFQSFLKSDEFFIYIRARSDDKQSDLYILKFR